MYLSYLRGVRLLGGGVLDRRGATAHKREYKQTGEEYA